MSCVDDAFEAPRARIAALESAVAKLRAALESIANQRNVDCCDEYECTCAESAMRDTARAALDETKETP